MDVILPIAILMIACIIASICGWCCKRKRQGTVYGPGGTMTITTQHVSASPVVVPPYPVDPRHPTPHHGAPAPGFATHHPPYPTHNPYPMAGASMYYPPPVAAAYPPMPNPAPYPPAGHPFPDFGNQPPSYSEAMGQPSQPAPPVKEGYAKQAPYNPNF